MVPEKLAPTIPTAFRASLATPPAKDSDLELLALMIVNVPMDTNALWVQEPVKLSQPMEETANHLTVVIPDSRASREPVELPTLKQLEELALTILTAKPVSLVPLMDLALLSKLL